MRIAPTLLIAAAMSASPLHAAKDDDLVSETVDRSLFVFSGSVSPSPEDEGGSTPLGMISFAWIEMYRSPMKDGAESRVVASIASCSGVTERHYTHVSEDRMRIKEGKAVSLSGRNSNIKNGSGSVRPVSIERLVVDRACWIAFGKAKGEPEPDFGVLPKDAKRITCITGKGSNELTHHIAFHEPTSRIFWMGRLATDSSLTPTSVSFTIQTGKFDTVFFADRITGKARFGPESDQYLSTGECSLTVAPKF